MKKETAKYIAVRIPETLFHRYKIALALQGETMQKTIQDAVEHYTQNVLDIKANTQ